MKRLLAVALYALCALPMALGCASRAAAPPSPPALSRGADAIPADLDVVVRVDLGRVRAALGPDILEQLQRAAELTAGSDGTEALVAEALARADVVLVGLRPRAAAELDHVLVLEGKFERFDPSRLRTDPPWHGAVDLGADLRRWDRRAAPSRGAPALAYAWGERVIVLATPAEIDSTERAVESGHREGALVPPSKGVLSFAARVLPLSRALDEKAPSIARLLRAAERLEGSAEIETNGVRLELSLKLDSAETAEQVREVLRAIADLLSIKSSTAELARSAEFDVAGDYVVCRLSVPRATIARWLSCAGGDEGGERAPGCSW